MNPRARVGESRNLRLCQRLRRLQLRVPRVRHPVLAAGGEGMKRKRTSSMVKLDG
jgi:hypothetical protein